MLRVVTDSTCDLPEELLREHGITTVPMAIDIDGEVFHEGIDVTPWQFYERMARSVSLPTTSQPAPAAFAEVFEAEPPGDPIICVTLSSELSGTYQSAVVGAELSGRNVTVFDALTTSIGLGLQVLRASELAEAGHDVADVVAELTAYRRAMTTLVLLNTVENIVKGGRLSRFQGSLSKALDIRALLRDEDGKVVLLEKVHGGTKLLHRAADIAHELHPDLSDRDVGITHFDNPAGVETLRERLTELCHPRGFVVNEMGPTMATYAGAGGIILAF